MPRHPLCALINLTTIIDHFLFDELFLNILIKISWTRNLLLLLLKKLHYLVFKEQNLREIISQNQVEKFLNSFHETF